MIDQLSKEIAKELGLGTPQVFNAVDLLVREECTIPFVARYRKEKTGSLDEVALRTIRDRYIYLSELNESRDKYLDVVKEHCAKKPELAAKFPELRAKFMAAKTKQELEDLYLPYKPKRRTRATIARDKGLEALADLILAQRATLDDLAAVALEFVSPPDSQREASLLVKTIEEALSGASDILAERFSEQADIRALVRKISVETGYLVAEAVKDADAKAAKKYENYFNYREPILAAAPHRVMAVRRGESEKLLKVSLDVDVDEICSSIGRQLFGGETIHPVAKNYFIAVIADTYKRLLAPTIETEIRLELKTKAEMEAIKVFAKNLENLLMLPPLPGRCVMGVDPGIRTGSKLAVVSATGALIEHVTIYPQLDKEEDPKTKTALQTLVDLVRKHNVSHLAIGNGTGGREINRLIVKALRESDLKDVKRLFVNESGASVYSTDDIAREEFPDLDPTIRSAISIARRLQDPLAELVKIDPRSIGVGQYQHDVNVNRLKSSLEEVVESCVNRVGVNVNSASYALLSYVSGVGKTLAKNIVTHRDRKKGFRSRAELTEVSGFGPKVFEQAAGFLRVPESSNPLDNSAVHPERYAVVEAMARDLKAGLADLVGTPQTVSRIVLEHYVRDDLGMPTLKDIASELVKPGRDPRADGEHIVYADDVAELEDLKLDMELSGTVTNVTNFGAFVDIGVHQEGLVHISELSDQFVKDPNTVVAVGQIVRVRVIGLDLERRRISLSCKSKNAPAAQPLRDQRPSRPPARSAGPSSPQQNHRPHSKPKPPPQKQDAKSYAPRYTMDDLLQKFNKS